MTKIEMKEEKNIYVWFLRLTRHAFRFICLLHIDCVFLEFLDEAKHRQFHNRTHSIAPYDRININKERNTEKKTKHNKYIVGFTHANSRWKETNKKSIQIVCYTSYVLLGSNFENKRPPQKPHISDKPTKKLNLKFHNINKNSMK